MVCIVVTNLMNNGYFGVYSSTMNARKAIENFFNSEPTMKLEQVDGNAYSILNTVTGERYWMGLTYDDIDADVPQEGE